MNLLKKICSALAVSILFVGFAIAEENKEVFNKSKTVRIGFYQDPRFQEGLSDDVRKTGYGYEYYKKVAAYNGWKYEYVYGEFDTLFEKLKTGEIDVLGGITYSTERSQYFYYPDFSMGNLRYYLFQNVDNPIINPKYQNSFKGKVIGGIKQGHMIDYLMEWGKRNSYEINVKNYDNSEKQIEDLRAKKIDAIVSIDDYSMASKGIVPVTKVGEEPYFLAVTKKRTDLLSDLNYSLNILNEIEPYFKETIRNENGGDRIISKRLSVIEEDWLAEHSVLKIGYLDDYMPYCDQSGGKPDGLLVDVMNGIISNLELKDRLRLEYKCYKSSNDLVNAIARDEVDIIFPISGATWENEKAGVTETAPVVVASLNLIYNGDFDEGTVSSLAINKNNYMQAAYLKGKFPDSDFLEFDSIEECLEAVKNGKATATTINGLRVDIVLKNDEFKNLSRVPLEQPDERTFGIKNGNFRLMLLMSRGLRVLGREYGANASYKYMKDLYKTSFKDMLKKHTPMIFILVFTVFSLIVFLLGMVIYRLKKEAKERTRYLKEIELARKDTLSAQIASTTDELTGFNNRRAYENHLNLAEQIGVSQEYTIVSLDVNGLKTVNDTLGHAAGDELIVGASHCIRESFGKIGQLYRIGGDEFAVLINECSKEELDYAVSLLKMETDKWKGRFVSELSISLGAASLRDFGGNSLAQLEVIADKRMYEDKSLFYTTRHDRRGSSRSAYKNILNHFIKVLKVDLLSGTFNVLKMNENEQDVQKGFSSGIFNWLRLFAEAGQIHKDDEKEYLKKTSVNYIMENFVQSDKPLRIFYKRKTEDGYSNVMLEMIKADDFSDENQICYLFVTDISQ